MITDKLELIERHMHGESGMSPIIVTILPFNAGEALHPIRGAFESLAAFYVSTVGGGLHAASVATSHSAASATKHVTQ